MKSIVLLLLLSMLGIRSFAATPSSALISETVTATSMCGGGSYVIFEVGNTMSSATNTLTKFTFTTTGTYSVSVVPSFTLYQYTSATWPGTATATRIATLTATAAAAQTFTLTSALAIAKNSTAYYFVVANVAAGATAASTIGVASVTTNATGSPFTFGTTPTYTGSGVTGGVTQTLQISPTAITGTSHICGSGTSALASTPSGGTWTSGTPAVASVSTSGVVTYLTNGTTNITYTLSDGCAAVYSFSDAVTLGPISGAASFCAPITSTLISQNFNSGLTGAIGGTWTVTGAATYGWTAQTPPGWTDLSAAGDGSIYMEADPDIASANISTTLLTPVFSTVGLSAANIAYNYYCNSNTSFDTQAEIDYSLDGSTWVVLYNYLGTVTGSTSWSVGTPTQNISLPAPALGQPTVYLRWNYVSNDGYYWAMDNVVITGSTASATTLTDGISGGTWTSGTTSVATISGGVVTGLTPGTTLISYANVCNTVTATANVLGVPAAIGGTPTTIGMTGSTTLTDATTNGTWTSGTTSVATIASTGVVTGIGVGTTVVTYSTGCGTATTQTVTVAAQALSVTPTSLNLGPISVGSTATVQSFTLSGTYLTGYSGNITVSSTDPEYKISSSSSGPWSTSYTVPYTTTTLTATPVYVQFTPTVTGVITASVTLSGGGATSPPSVALTGSGANSCTLTPTAPTAMTFPAVSGSSASVSFTPSGTPDGYMLLKGTAAFSGTPANGTTYTVGNVIGTGTVIATAYTTSPTFTATGLTSNTKYYFTVIPYYGGSGGTCVGGPLYSTGTQLSASVTTCAGVPTAVTASSVTTTSEKISWTAPAGGTASTLNYSVDISTTSTFSTVVTGSPFAAGTATSVTATGLPSGSTLYYRVTATGVCSGSVSATGTFGVQPIYAMLPITSGLNGDGICEGSANPTTTENFGTGAGLDGTSNNNFWVANTYTYGGASVATSAGFPTTNVITSTALAGLSWQIGPYVGGPNILQLNGVTSGTVTTTGTFSFAPVYGTTFYMIGASENGPVSSNVTLQYSDGTSATTTTWTVPDWGGGATGYDVSGYDRVTITSGSVSAANFALYKDVITNPNTSKMVSGITVTNTSGATNSNISLFGVSALASYLKSNLSSVSFGNVNVCGSGSIAQTFTVSGSQLPAGTGSVVATASSGFQISLNGTVWSSSVTASFSGGVIGNTPIYAKAVPTVAGALSGNITFSGTTLSPASCPTVALSATGIGDVACSPSTTATFGAITTGTVSPVQVFTLTSNIPLSAGTLTVTSSNSDFQVSKDGTTWGSSFSISYGSSFTQNLYLRFSPSISGAEAASVTVAGSTVSCYMPTVACTGVGAVACVNPSVPTSLIFTGTNASSTSVSFTPPGTAPDGYLLLKGTSAFSGSPVGGAVYTVGATIGTGTVVASSYTTAPSYAITGLTANTTYYYTVIPFNGGSGGTCAGSTLYATGTQLSGPVTTCPAAPTAPTTISVSGTTAVVSWTAPAGGSGSTLNYSVDVSTSSTFSTVVTGSPFAAGTSTSVTVTGLTLGATMYYRVSATGSCTGVASATGTISVPSVVYTPIPLTSGLNSDVICEGSASWTTSESFGTNGVDADGSAFVADGYSGVSGTAGFPTTNIVSSTATTGLTWQIAPYGVTGSSILSNNALQLMPAASGSIPASPTGTFSFSPVYANSFYLLGTAENGGSGLSTTVNINYTDGTSSNSTWTVYDWGSGSGTIAASMDRLGSGTPSSGGFYLYQNTVTNPNPAKLVGSISFTNTATAGGANVTIFGASMKSSYVSASLSSLSFGNTSICSGSTSQLFVLSAVQLYPATGSVTVNAPAGFKVSLDGSTWASSVAPTYSGSTLGNTTIYVEATPSVVGLESGYVTFSGANINGIYTPSVAVSATGISQIAVAPSYTAVAAFGPVNVGSVSPAIAYTLSATGLSAGTLTVTSSNVDFKVSPDGSTWSTSYSIPYSSSLSATLYIQYTPTVTGAETSSISISGSTISCPPPNIACTGNGSTPCSSPSQLSAITISGVTNSAATASITPTTTPDGYLYVLGTSSFSGSPAAGTTYTVGASLGGGTVVAYTTALTYNLTGLASNTQYYLTAIPFKGGPTGTCSTGPLYPSGTPVTTTFTTCPSVPGIATVTTTYTAMTFSVTPPSGGSALPVSYSIGVYANSSFTSPVTGSPFAATSSTYTVTGLAAGTTYYYQVQSVTSQCSSGYVTGSATTGSYCTPGISYNCDGYYTTSVALNGLSQSVGCGATNYLSDTYSVTAGVTYTMTTVVSSGSVGSAAWIDYGNDGFNGSGDNVADNLYHINYNGTTTSYAEAVTVPTTVVTGTYRMRVIGGGFTDCYSTSETTYGYGPCGTVTYLYGSYQDFNIYIFNPQVKASTSSLSFGSVSSCSSSTAQIFSVSATGLVPSSGSLTVTPTSGFQVSLNGSTWSSTVTVPYTLASVSATPVYVMASPTVTGTFTGSVTVTGGSALTPPVVTLSGTGTGIALSPSSAANFGVIAVATTSPALVYTVSGSGLTAGTTYVTTSNPDFQVSPDGTTYSTSGYNFASGTSISGSSLYITYSPTVVGTETATITVTAPSGCAQTIIANGSGSNIPCTTPGTPTAMTFSGTNSSSTTVNFTTSGSPDGYLLVKSILPLTSGPVNTTNYSAGASVGGGTVVGVYSTATAYTVTGLAGNTQYYFTLYPFNGGIGGSCGGGPIYGSSASNYVNTCPATPTSISSSGVTSSGFNLSWSSSLSGGAASSLSYSIDVSTTNTFSVVVTGSPFSVTDPTTTLSIGGLTPGTTYYYRITAVGAGTCSSPASATGTVSLPNLNYNPMTVTSGFNVDIIANSTHNPANGTLGTAGTSSGTFAGFDNANNVYLSSDYNYAGNTVSSTNSFPVSGLVSSTATSGLQYHLASYDSYNVLLAKATVAGTMGTLSVTPQYANNLYIIGATGAGGGYGGLVTFKINYQDGTTQSVSNTYQFFDWGGTGTSITTATSTSQDIKQLAEVNTTSGGVSANNYYLYQAVLTPTYTASPIVSIVPSIVTTLGGHSAAGYLGLYAISARTGALYPSLSSETFGSVTVCSTSPTQNFTVSGSSLLSGSAVGTVVATAPAGFQVSTTGTSGWGTTVSYVATGTTTGVISGSTVYVRFAPSVSGTFSGNITFSGAGINNAPTVAVSGTCVGGTITGTTTVCQNATTTLSDIVTGGTWSSTNAAVASVSTLGVVTGRSAGTAVISYLYGCAATANTVSVTVNAIPTTTGVTYNSLCSGTTLSLFSNATGASTYSWSGPAAFTDNTVANPTSATPVTATANGVYSVTLTTALGCSITAATSPSVTVNAQPSATVTPSSLNLCTGSVETLTSAVTGGAGTPTYTWSGPGITGTTATGATTTYSLVPSASSGSYSLAISYSVSTGCTTAAATTATVNITPAASITSLTPSSVSLCSGGTLTLTATETGGSGTPTYTWKGPGMSTTTSSSTPLVFTPTVTTLASAAYSVTVSFGGAGCAPTSVVTSTTVAVNIQPTVSVSASPLVICNGSNMTLTTASGGGAGTPTYTWSGPGITTATGSLPGAVSYTPAVSTGAYSVSLSYSGIGCNVVNASSSSVTVNPQPSVAVTASTVGLLCTGMTETITATPSGGSGTAAYTWSGPGISGTAGPFASSVYTVTPAAGATAGVYSVAVTYSVAGCNTASNTTATVTPTGQQWAGGTSTSWNDPTNWACGIIPTATQDVVIPASTPNAPTLDVSTGYTKKLTITGATLTLGSGNQLDIVGNLVNNGTVTGSGVIYLNGGSAQVLSGNGNVSNMTLANSAGATINSTSDTVGITGTLLLNSGTLTTNGNLMLVSNSGGSGSIGQITGGSISGNVIMQQYVPGGRRAYRFIAHPFNASIPLSQIQNYIDITGTGGSANGFTTTASNSASAFWYNTAIGNSALGNDPGWTAYTSTNGSDSNAFNKNEGIRLFFRGSKGEGLTGSSYTIDPVTYRTWGAVNTGAQSITLVKGTGANEDYNTIGNPYPAITDIGSVIDTASTGGLLTGAAFYIWNPYLGTSGQFVTETIGGSYYLGANESFQVRTATNHNTLSFAESNKGTAVTNALMRTASNDYLTLYIYDNSYHPWDLLHINFNDAATDNEDSRYDGAKAPSPASLNFYSLSADNSQLSLDSRPFNDGKVIPLGIKSSYLQDFIIKAQNVAVPDNGQVYLHDKYLQTYTQLLQGTEYKFTITKDAASQGDNRFELSMKKAGAAIAQAADGLDVQMVPNPATSVVTISYNAAAKAQTTVRVMNVEGITVLTQDLGLQQSGSTQIALDRLASGVYMVEFTSGTQKVVHRLVKE